MIIIDPEKYELMEQNHKAEDTSSAATGTGTDRRSLRRQRRKKRFLKSFLHSIGFFLLFLGLKAFTRRRHNVWSFDDSGESHYPHGRPHHRHGHGPGHPRHRLSTEEREKLFLYVPLSLQSHHHLIRRPHVLIALSRTQKALYQLPVNTPHIHISQARPKISPMPKRSSNSSKPTSTSLPHPPNPSSQLVPPSRARQHSASPLQVALVFHQRGLTSTIPC